MNFKNSYLSYLLMYFFYYMSFALLSVLTAVYLLDKHFNSVDVSIVVSLGLITSMLISPIVGYFNDKYGAKRINGILLLISAIVSPFITLTNSIIAIAIIYAISFSLLNSVNGAVEKMATLSPFRYGLIRIWGTIGFSVGTFLSGFIYHNISKDAIYLSYAMAIIVCVLGMLLIDDTIKQSVNTHNTIQKINVKNVFINKNFVIYLIAVSLFYSVQNVSSTHLPAMLKTNGLDVSFVSNIISIAVLVELPLVLFSHIFMDKIKSKYLLFIFLIGTVCSTLVYAFSVNVILQLIVTLVFKHTMGMLFIMTNLKIVRILVQKELQVSALSIVSATNSTFAMMLQFAGGFAINQGGYTMLYIVLFSLILMAILISTTLSINDTDNISMFNK